jgi:hypothetical protein
MRTSGNSLNANFALTEFSDVGIALVPEHPKPTALLADAITGTGKSLAYLLPAALSGSRMVISTVRKALQHQLVGKRPTPRALPPPYGETVPDTFLLLPCAATQGRFKAGAA